MKKIFSTIVALTLGLVLGNVTVLGARAVTQALSYHPDPALKVCWTQAVDQTVPDLAAANAMKVRIQYGLAPPVDVTHVCSGTTGPFTCTSQVPVPMTLQVVGTNLNVTVQGATVDSVDGSLTPYSTLVSGTFSFTAAPLPPTPGSGSNLRLVKVILAAIAVAALAIWHFFT
jgi:hypothetical protein